MKRLPTLRRGALYRFYWRTERMKRARLTIAKYVDVTSGFGRPEVVIDGRPVFGTSRLEVSELLAVEPVTDEERRTRAPGNVQPLGQRVIRDETHLCSLCREAYLLSLGHNCTLLREQGEELDRAEKAALEEALDPRLRCTKCRRPAVLRMRGLPSGPTRPYVEQALCLRHAKAMAVTLAAIDDGGGEEPPF